MPGNSSKKVDPLFLSAILPIIFVLVLLFIFISSVLFESGIWSDLALHPRMFSHFYTSFTFPFLHGSFPHFINNASALIILGTLLRYFHHKNSILIFMLIFLIHGPLTFFIASGGRHVGASGIIFGLASFLLFNGVWSKNRSLMSVALVVVFLYGGMIWGILPQDGKISWEGHLAGFICGLVLSFFYVKHEPPRPLDENKQDFDIWNYRKYFPEPPIDEREEP